MLRFIFLLIAIAIAACAMAFMFQNDTTAPIDLFFAQLDNLTVGQIALAGFVFGGLFGLLVGSGMWLRVKTREISTKRKLVKSEKELESLRSDS